MMRRLAAAVSVWLLATFALPASPEATQMRAVLTQDDLDPRVPGIEPRMHMVELAVLSDELAMVTIKAARSVTDVERVRAGMCTAYPSDRDVPAGPECREGWVLGIRLHLGVDHFKSRCWQPGYGQSESWEHEAPFSYVHIYREPAFREGAYIDIWFYPPGLQDVALSSTRSDGTFVLELKYRAIGQ